MNILEINVRLFRMINDLGKEYSMLNPVMVFSAKYMVFFLAFMVIMFLFTRNKLNRIIVLCGAITFVISELIGKLVGKIHFNYQPFVELTNVNQLIEKDVGNSFPSDLTILFFSFCMSFWLFKRGWTFLWLLLAVWVGVARIWVGVHYPADVLVGAIISIIVATIIYKVIRKLSIIDKLIPTVERGDSFVLSARLKQKEEKSEHF